MSARTLEAFSRHCRRMAAGVPTVVMNPFINGGAPTEIISAPSDRPLWEQLAVEADRRLAGATDLTAPLPAPPPSDEDSPLLELEETATP